MQIIIQAVESRLDNVLKMLNDLPDETIIHVDKERKGTFGSFVDILNNYEIKGPRLHLQDDVILAKGFEIYLETLKRDFVNEEMNVLSLFSLKRKKVTLAYKNLEKYAEYHPFLMLQSVIFSERVLKGMKEYVKTNKFNHDDVMVREYLKLKNIKAKVHLPNIVQHNIYLGSEINHPNSKNRMSPYYVNKI